MKRFSRVLGILALVAIVSMALVPLALATRATPSVSLKAKPATVRVGKIVTFTGTVKNAVTKDATVKLWLVSGKKSVLKSSGTISGTGTFWFTAKAAKAGTCTLRVTYRAGTAIYRSPKVKVTITK
jgi:hypothetical protein